MSRPLEHPLHYSSLPRKHLQLIGMRCWSKYMMYHCCNEGMSALKGSGSRLEYGHVASRLTGCVVTTLYSTVRRSRLGLHLGEQDAKGGEDEGKVGAETQHGSPLFC